MFPEILIHYIWQQGLFLPYRQSTTDGRTVEVLHVGQHNRDAGPDFTNVRLRLSNPDGNQSIEIAGNIEIHLKSSDWYRHHHDTDAAYDNIILHVVREADEEVRNSCGQLIPQCVLQYPADQDYLKGLMGQAGHMDNTLEHSPCTQRLLREPDLITLGWKETLLRHRLRCKSQSIGRLLTITKGSWDDAFYISMAHSFGFHTNGIPFEMVAIQTPLKILLKHKSNLFQLTALLMGQAGILDPSYRYTRPRLRSEEYERLWKEYTFLRHKYTLTPIDGNLWKYARMRPQNFPDVRLRQFAALLYDSEFLFSRLMQSETMRQMEACMQVETLPMGIDAIRSILINTAIPYLYARGKEQEAIQRLNELPAEKNTIIRQWQMMGQKVSNAADSQALIHLYTVYCQSEQCMNCEVAYQIFLPDFLAKGDERGNGDTEML